MNLDAATAQAIFAGLLLLYITRQTYIMTQHKQIMKNQADISAKQTVLTEMSNLWNQVQGVITETRNMVDQSCVLGLELLRLLPVAARKTEIEFRMNALEEAVATNHEKLRPALDRLAELEDMLKTMHPFVDSPKSSHGNAQ